jgi:hypothetical protein
LDILITKSVELCPIVGVPTLLAAACWNTIPACKPDRGLIAAYIYPTPQSNLHCDSLLLENILMSLQVLNQCHLKHGLDHCIYPEATQRRLSLARAPSRSYRHVLDEHQENASHFAAGSASRLVVLKSIFGVVLRSGYSRDLRRPNLILQKRVCGVGSMSFSGVKYDEKRRVFHVADCAKT